MTDITSICFRYIGVVLLLSTLTESNYKLRQERRHTLSLSFFFLFIYFYQLETNYFTTLQWVLSYIDMNQPWSYMYQLLCGEFKFSQEASYTAVALKNYICNKVFDSQNCHRIIVNREDTDLSLTSRTYSLQRINKEFIM